MHGMAEMHFWVFISSTALIIYQNWRLQVPMILIVYVHHGTFAYLQYLGVKEVYFTQLEYMDLTTFLFHAVLATGVCLVAALWGHNIRQRTLRDALNFKTLQLLQEELHKNAEQTAQLNRDLMRVNKEIQEKNEELLASEEELTASTEALIKTNENLNSIVESKTNALLKQNTMLMQHAFLNAHKVRSPLARILGLVNLLGYEVNGNVKGKELMSRLNDSATELDTVLKEIKANLEAAEYKDGHPQ
jgi:signal transduction histidine kinase